ncbi:glutamate-5-semialdehyde dehydrogenase [Ileibacterium valens]|uniref:Gamma-glutamyl phosphate reductase n=1 Tax=Ileibacterium valens TaxID=1862668 RepID=A0A1U7NEM9_9FIRM|nr:glutamate-5-semialdehyde dehydrogenase [Ileibacterium valens]OLU38146.1 glutamate-5-semialdehyde dehydrogenase [Ileibacterium valens]OLU42138.1 glutamate-5-semialdehyde dehydrogenase [Erysipelotrichaceae bacterium NYU-BL-F16]OLU42391.1 glutamate-5-semialdehyde dehydrogenase [Erysipelotrichaceae bacterium NYU-BL-E8]
MLSAREAATAACQAKYEAAKLTTDQKNKALIQAASDLRKNTDKILEANAKDVLKARENGMAESLVDRLMLTAARIDGMAKGLEDVASLDDPVGEVIGMKKRPNGLLIGQKRVPLGTVAVIYEARPNVTADVFGLTFKSGNTAVLKGGKDAAYSNQAIIESIHESLNQCNITPDVAVLMEDNSRAASNELMKMNDLIDVLIPRGGAGLIRSVVENATIPVIETGTGNCHVFVDEDADPEMAVNIIINGKTQRTGVCNAVESLLIHEKIADTIMPALAKALQEKNVEIRVDDNLLQYVDGGIKATEEDWGTEYLDLIVSMKTVKDIDEAIAHINKYNTGHSESIVTKSYANAQKFLDQVDAAAVYVNASTRFTDGAEFGLGAEIGISTQKLHARGPMGLKELTTTKYIIYGDGQIRP